MAVSTIGRQDGHLKKDDITVYRNGKLRILRLDTPSEWMATLSVVDRPSIPMNFVGTIYDGTQYVDCTVSVETDGKVQVRDIFGGTIPGAQYGFLSPRCVTYFVD